MNIVDSSGWIEYVTDEVNASFFEPPIVDSEKLLIPTICLYEVFKRVLREFGEDRALDAMGVMSLGTIIDLDRQIAIHAAQISHELKLAMADSMILATARAHNATLWTQDEHFRDIEGVRYKEKKSRK
ncbi:MAG TPA: type II toxin-antitoxin system VapC family toxin [Anaerolineales bacterium]|nr:type II toxin-antitoxin system VapC family toxin [Anaerolineales bacterium]HLO33264.1 type II toxin-antitoxin system VapC family toxin [Anaerolineales bacterium]